MIRCKKQAFEGEKGRIVIGSGRSSGGLEPGSGLWLYFDAGADCDRAIVARQLESAGLLAGHMSKIGGASSVGGHAVPDYELLLDGLTFDAFVYAPPVRGAPEYPAQSGQFSAGELDARCALLIIPGPHLDGAPRSLPVVRGQWRLAARVCEALPQVTIAGWPPSGTLLAANAFSACATGWTAGAPFPAWGLITLRPAMGSALQSMGLAYFIGQELRIEADLATDADHITRLGLRIAEMLAHRGPLEQVELFAGPDGGAVRLEPSANGRFVRVWPG